MAEKEIDNTPLMRRVSECCTANSRNTPRMGPDDTGVPQETAMIVGMSLKVEAHLSDNESNVYKALSIIVWQKRK